MKCRCMARASGYSSFGFSASSSLRLERIACGTYHTDHTAPRPSLKSCCEGKFLRESSASRSASGCAAVKSAIACFAAAQST